MIAKCVSIPMLFRENVCTAPPAEAAVSQKWAEQRFAVYNNRAYEHMTQEVNFRSYTVTPSNLCGMLFSHINCRKTRRKHSACQEILVGWSFCTSRANNLCASRAEQKCVTAVSASTNTCDPKLVYIKRHRVDRNPRLYI